MSGFGKFKWMGLALAAVLSGCALSPQQLQLAPVVEEHHGGVGSGNTINLQVVDNRSVKEFGTRGGVYEKTSLITAKNDVAEAVGSAMEGALRQMGFNVNRFGGESGPTLTVYVDQILLTSPNQNYASDIQLKAALRGEVKNGMETYTGTYRKSGERRYAAPPDEEENAEQLNQVVGDCIEAMLSDKRLVDYLR